MFQDIFSLEITGNKEMKMKILSKSRENNAMIQ